MMALVYVAEFERFGYGEHGIAIPAPNAPWLIVQSPIDFSTGEAKSDAFDDRTRYVLITTDETCFYTFDVDPTATVNDMPLWANLYAGFSVRRAAGMKLSVIGP